MSSLSSSFCPSQNRGLTFTSARVFISSTCRQSRLAHRRKGLHFACSPCSQQNIDVANHRIATKATSAPKETAGQSACASLTLPFRIGPSFCTLFSVVFTTVPWLCAVFLLLPCMLMVLLFFPMITVHTSASGSNAKMLGISATTLYAVGT